MAVEGRLKANAVGMWDAVIFGLASSGPAVTVAGSLAAMVAVAAYGGVVPVFLCFIPMVGIAIGYQRLNLWNQDCGTTYAWVAKAINPYAGFLAGWLIIAAYTLGTLSLTLPGGSYLLTLFDPRLASNTVAVAVTGSILNVGVTLLAAYGIQLAAKFQWVLAAFEYVVLLGFAVAAIWFVAHGGPGSVPFSMHAFSLSAMGGMKGLLSGLLVAVFFYAGWDSSMYVNEETQNKETAPGKAAISSVVILLFLYAIVLFAFQGVVSGKTMQADAANILSVIATRITHGGWLPILMSVVVLTSTIASLQAAVISAARLGVSMGRDRVLPRGLAAIHPRIESPWAATWFFSGLNLVFLWASVLIGSVGAALGDIVSSLGVMFSLFYALTAAAALWYYRRALTQSLKTFLFGGVLPFVGGGFLLWAVVMSVATGALTPAVLAGGLGTLAAGVVAVMISRWAGNAPFFHMRREAYAAPEPPPPVSSTGGP